MPPKKHADAETLDVYREWIRQSAAAAGGFAAHGSSGLTKSVMLKQAYSRGISKDDAIQIQLEERGRVAKSPHGGENPRITTPKKRKYQERADNELQAKRCKQCAEHREEIAALRQIVVDMSEAKGQSSQNGSAMCPTPGCIGPFGHSGECLVDDNLLAASSLIEDWDDFWGVADGKADNEDDNAAVQVDGEMQVESETLPPVDVLSGFFGFISNQAHTAAELKELYETWVAKATPSQSAGDFDMSDRDALQPLELAEYRKFLDVNDFEVDLADIAILGARVARFAVDGSWGASIRGGSYSMTRFLHTSESRLPQKMKDAVYAQKPLNGVVVAVVGGGVAGLRFSIEASLLGATVHIIEKRRRYNRYNVLKIWSYTLYDLVSLGVKDLYPALTTFQVKRVPIAVLCHALLRVALTLGVHFHPGCDTEGLAENGHLVIPDNQELSKIRFHAVFDATGTDGVLRDGGKHPLIETSTTAKELIGLTMNFRRFNACGGENEFFNKSMKDPRFNKVNPAKSDETNLSDQFHADLFGSKAVRINNFAHWKSASSHYIVLTIPRQTLIDHGVVPPWCGKVQTSTFLQNVDHSRLAELGIVIAADWNFPHASPDCNAYVQIQKHSTQQPDIALFNYGDTCTATSVACFLEGRLFFGILGDAIEKPFWPYGTGGNRAIYSAMLQAMALLRWAHMKQDQTTVIAVANAMKRKMLAIPITGNKVNFSEQDYVDLVRQMYVKTMEGVVPELDCL